MPSPSWDPSPISMDGSERHQARSHTHAVAPSTAHQSERDLTESVSVGGGASRDSADGRGAAERPPGDPTDANVRVPGGAFCRMLVRQPAYWLGRANGLWVFGTQNYAELLRAAFACTHTTARWQGHTL
jgi:hypothetical protein